MFWLVEIWVLDSFGTIRVVLVLIEIWVLVID